MGIVIIRDSEKLTPEQARASLLLQIKAVGLPEPVCKYTGDGKECMVVPQSRPAGINAAMWLLMTRPDGRSLWKCVRKSWRFDYAYPQIKLAFELDGAVWSNGRHNRGKGMLEDRDKINAAQILGWTVYRLTYDQIADGRAIALIEAAYALCLARHSKK